MMQPNHPLLRNQVPVYRVKINTSAFQYHKPALLQKIQQEYLPKYWELMHMDQKRVGPSCEDRLSELTTSQIDRIIDMEKIRSILYDKKKKKKEIFYQLNSNNNPNKHSHIYEANFLAKINALAIKRNIRHQTSQQFDSPSHYLTHNSQHDKKLSAVCKYKKSYSIDCSELKRTKASSKQVDGQYSFSQLDNQLQKFQQNLQKNKKIRETLSRKKKRKFQQSRLCNKTRWFCGMSKLAFDQSASERQTAQVSYQRCGSVDIEGQLSYSKKNVSLNDRSHGKSSFAKNATQTKKINFSQPLEKFKITRVSTIE